MKSEDKQAQYERAKTLLAEQNFVAAALVGAAATILAALAYAVVVMKWPFSFGFAVAGVGIVVGAAMQFLGRGIDTKFAVLAAAYTVAGVGLGNFFLAVLPQVVSGSLSPAQALTGPALTEAIETSTSYLTAGHLIYLLIALIAAVFLVRRPLSRADRLALGLFRMREQG